MNTARDGKNNPADQFHQEPGRSTVSPLPVNLNDSCVIPPRRVSKRADQESRELKLDDFETGDASATS